MRFSQKQLMGRMAEEEKSRFCLCLICVSGQAKLAWHDFSLLLRKRFFATSRYKSCTVDRCTLLPEMMAGDYHISFFAEARRPLKVCVPGEAIQVPLNWIQGKQNHALSLHWTRYRVGFIQTWGLSPLIRQNFVLLHTAKETIQPASGMHDFWCF